MKKIFYITNGINGTGGLERVLSIKASYLGEKLGYEVHILTLNQGNEKLYFKFSDRLYFHDIQVEGNPIRYFLCYRKEICRVVKEVQPDVISVCDDGLKGLFVPVWLGRKIPLVYERHTTKWAYLNVTRKGFACNLMCLITDRLLNFGSSLYDRFVVLTQQNGLEWPKARVEIFPNPISFYPDVPASHDNKRVISVGTYSHIKGFDLLIRAWSQVAKVFPDWELAIFGRNVNCNDLQRLINDLNLQDHINLYPPTSDILEEYKMSSVYALSSRYEGFGMVLIEAMACGVPCISFDCPCGPGDIITDGEDGYLVPPEDVNALAEKLMDMMGNEAMRKQMGARARENVRRYLPDVILSKWNFLFKELVNRERI